MPNTGSNLSTLSNVTSLRFWPLSFLPFAVLNSPRSLRMLQFKFSEEFYVILVAFSRRRLADGRYAQVPDAIPSMDALQVLIIEAPSDLEFHVQQMFNFVSVLIRNAPLQELHVRSAQLYNNRAPGFDSGRLLASLKGTLRVLAAGKIAFSPNAIMTLFRRCPGLEGFSVAMRDLNDAVRALSLRNCTVSGSHARLTSSICSIPCTATSQRLRSCVCKFGPIVCARRRHRSDLQWRRRKAGSGAFPSSVMPPSALMAG